MRVMRVMRVVIDSGGSGDSGDSGDNGDNDSHSLYKGISTKTDLLSCLIRGQLDFDRDNYTKPQCSTMVKVRCTWYQPSSGWCRVKVTGFHHTALFINDLLLKMWLFSFQNMRLITLMTATRLVVFPSKQNISFRLPLERVWVPGRIFLEDSQSLVAFLPQTSQSKGEAVIW